MHGKRRRDYDTSCPVCGGHGVLSNKVSLIHYRCTECENRYKIKPNVCKACGEWIADGAEYCEWHSRHGFDDEKDEDIITEGLCLRCKKNRTYDIYEYCWPCLKAERAEDRDKARRSRESEKKDREAKEERAETEEIHSDLNPDDDYDDTDEDLEDDGLLDDEEAEEADDDPWDIDDDWDDD